MHYRNTILNLTIVQKTTNSQRNKSHRISNRNWDGFLKLVLALVRKNINTTFHFSAEMILASAIKKYNSYLKPDADVTKFNFSYRAGDYVVHAYHEIG
ncbi:MAG: hypothetical protein HUJ51_05005 [Eggerthellaceae bacterium]|nr:hypothetical protein [Eggerthellaceae bacterium]